MLTAMATIYDFIVDLDSKAHAQLEKLTSNLNLDMIAVFQLTSSHQTLKYAWPKSTKAYQFSFERFSAIQLRTMLPQIYSHLKAFTPFFDPVDDLPESQARILHATGIKSAMFIPIQYEGHLWGFISCLCTKTKRTWKSTELSYVLRDAIDMTYNILLIEFLADLKEGDENLRYTLSYITDGIVTTDENNLITNVSGHITEFGGYRLDELIGQNFKRFIYQDDWERLDQHLKKTMEQDGDQLAENYRLLLKTGDPYWARITATPLRKLGIHRGFVCLIRDMDSYLKAEVQLNNYKDLMQYTTDLVWITDMHLLFTYVSPSIQHLLGYSVEEAMHLNGGLTLTKKTHERLHAAFIEGLRAARRGDLDWKHALPVEQFHRNGTKLTGELLLAIHKDREGRAAGFIGVSRFNLRTSFTSWHLPAKVEQLKD
jgi:PAS domain S-box-containing protein